MVSFVILHYKAVTDTIECIESILKTIESDIDFNIVVVDNGSKDGSGEKLTELYQDYNNVTVLINKNNAGFANGNNIGCNFAISHNEPDFLIVLNNDTLIEQSDFIDKIIQEYQSCQFDMLGPDIITLDDVHQNPTTHYSRDLKHVKKRIFKLEVLHFFAIMGFAVQLLLKRKREKQSFSKEPEARSEDVPLHGSALVFSKKYYTKFENVFYDKTFMYCEEDILYHRSILFDLKTVYTPAIRVRHKEDISTNILFQTSLKKELFVLKNTIMSLKVLRDMIVEIKKKES